MLSELTTDEEMSPTLENTITWLWLKLLNPALPQLVQQRYGADLRNKSLASLKSEISQAMTSLLDEVASSEESRVFRTGNRASRKPGNRASRQPGGGQRMSCVLCKTAGRPHNSHWLSQCTFLPAEDKKALSRATNCDINYDSESEDENVEDEDEGDDNDEADAYLDTRRCRRVGNMASPVLDFLFRSSTLSVTLYSGSTSNHIREDVARRCGLKIHPATQCAGQADGV